MAHYRKPPAITTVPPIGRRGETAGASDGQESTKYGANESSFVMAE
jgi:hypothetical protein